MNYPVLLRHGHANHRPGRTLCAAITLLLLGLPAYGQQWETLNISKLKGTTLYGLDVPAAGVIYAIGYGATGRPAIYKTTDAGENWNAVSVPGMSLFDFHFTDASTGFVGGRGTKCGCAVIGSTTDGGAHWELDTVLNAGGGIEHFGSGDGMSSFYFSDATTGYGVGAHGLIAKTTDGGRSWHTTSTGTTVNFFTSIAVPAGGFGYALSTTPATPNSANRLYRSTDGGEHWTSIPAFHEWAAFPNITFLTPRIGFIAGWDSTGVIYKTTDGGETWSRKYSGDTNLVMYAVAFRDAKEGFAVGTAGTILHTNDGGESWNTERSGDTIVLSDVAMTSDMVYAIGPGGFLRRPLAQSGADRPERPADHGVIITPNPLSDHASVIPSTLPPGSSYRFVLYDLLGREVRRIEGLLGEHGIELSNRDLPPRRYLYRLSSREGVIGVGSVAVR